MPSRTHAGCRLPPLLLPVNPATANPAPLGLYGELLCTVLMLLCIVVRLGGALCSLPLITSHSGPAGFALTTALLQGAKTQLSEPAGTTQVRYPAGATHSSMSHCIHTAPLAQ